MKIQILLIIFFTSSIIGSAQSIERDVISSSGDCFEEGNISLSWTLGEIATETYNSVNIILTQGFQQSFGIVIHGIDLNVLVYLEGPYNAGSMFTILKDEQQIPLYQPYDVSPWLYEGTESVAAIPDNVVDWVLVDLRDASSAAAALPSTSVEKQAAFILNNGSIVDIDGSSVLQFTSSINNYPYVVVWHRNHIGILSATSPVETGGIYTYDFSTSITKAHGGGQGYSNSSQIYS